MVGFCLTMKAILRLHFKKMQRSECQSMIFLRRYSPCAVPKSRFPFERKLGKCLNDSNSLSAKIFAAHCVLLDRSYFTHTPLVVSNNYSSIGAKADRLGSPNKATSNPFIPNAIKTPPDSGVIHCHNSPVALLLSRAFCRLTNA